MKINGATVEGFVKAILRKHFDSPAETPQCHKEWWEMCCSDHKFVAIAAPRGHAKSTAVTLAYTLTALLFRERQFVLLVSDTEAQSSFFLNNMKRIIEIDEDLRHMFGVVKISKDTETDFIVDFEDNYQARVIAKGSEQKLRGINWNNKRPDLIVCDDMENDEIVMNQERREKFRHWFASALLPCRSRDGVVRFVGTILHMDSQLERLMPKDHDKQVIRTPLKSATPMKYHWYAVKYRAHSDDWKEILWPDYRDKEWLIHEREMYKSQGQLDKYAQEYLNIPLDETNSFFRKTDFGKITEEDENKSLNYYLSCDLAVSVKNRADWTVLMISGMDSDGKLYIIDLIRERMDSMQTAHTILSLNKKYDFDFCVFEKGAITASILPFLNISMVEQNNYITIHTINPSVDKMTRAQSIRARMRAGSVKFPHDADWFFNLQQEAMRFPRDLHDDQVDAMSLLGLALDKFVQAKTPLEEAEEEYYMEFNESGLATEGRSTWTGY